MSALGEWDDDPVDGGTEPAAPELVPDFDDHEDAPAADPATLELYFDSLEAFVSELLAPTYRRSLAGNDRTWCPEWWRHAEAIARLDALWRAWEHLRLDPALGISAWFRDHADPHMAVLLDAEGPFKTCSPEKGHSDRLTALPVTTAPADLLAMGGR